MQQAIIMQATLLIRLSCYVMTATTFKDRYRNHKKSFEDIKHENDTELSKHVWKLKLDNKQFSIYWSILSRANSIKAGGNS